MLDLVADFGQVLVEWGLASSEEGGDAKSIICVNTVDFETEDEVSEWLQEQANNGAYLAVPIADFKISIVNGDGTETEI